MGYSSKKQVQLIQRIILGNRIHHTPAVKNDHRWGGRNLLSLLCFIPTVSFVFHGG